MSQHGILYSGKPMSRNAKLQPVLTHTEVTAVSMKTIKISASQSTFEPADIQGPTEISDDLQNSSEWKRWRGEFVLERSSSETQSISVAMQRRSVEHRAFVVETYFKNNDSVLTQRIFGRHINIHRNECP
jgi:hypothetical protein